MFAILTGTKHNILQSTDAVSNWTTIYSTDFQLGKITFNDNVGFDYLGITLEKGYLYASIFLVFALAITFKIWKWYKKQILLKVF